MSDTDKTDPYWVKVKEYRNCFPRTEDDFPRSYRAYKWWHPAFRCGCGLCGWPSRSKQLRADDKRAIMQGLRDYYEE